MLLTNGDFRPDDVYDFAVSLLAALLLPAGVLVISVLIVVGCVACKCSKKEKNKKKKEENMEVDNNPVYQIYELVGENYERKYSTDEIVDHNPDYA